MHIGTSANFFPLLYALNTLLYLAMISVGRQATKVREELVNKDELVNQQIKVAHNYWDISIYKP